MTVPQPEANLDGSSGMPNDLIHVVTKLAIKTSPRPTHPQDQLALNYGQYDNRLVHRQARFFSPVKVGCGSAATVLRNVFQLGFQFGDPLP